MSIDYKAVVYYGKEFSNSEEALEFYKKYNELSEDDLDRIYIHGFVDYLLDYTDLTGEVLNSYTGSGFLLGFNITDELESALECEDNELFTNLGLRWKYKFPNVKMELLIRAVIS